MFLSNRIEFWSAAEISELFLLMTTTTRRVIMRSLFFVGCTKNVVSSSSSCSIERKRENNNLLIFELTVNYSATTFDRKLINFVFFVFLKVKFFSRSLAKKSSLGDKLDNKKKKCQNNSILIEYSSL